MIRAVTALLEPKRRLGDLLVQRGYLTEEQLQNVLEEQRSSRGTKLLGELLVDRGWANEDQVLECLAVELGLPFVKLDSRLFDVKIVDSLSRELIDKHTVLPLFKVRDTLTVAISEPTNVFLVEQLREYAKCEIQVVIATGKDIRRMVQTYLPNERVFVIDDIIEDARDDAVKLIEASVEDIAVAAEAAGQSPIIKLVNYILYNAVKDRASDIHIEPGDRLLRIRYRVDGALYQSLELPMNLAPAVASRIKIMASLDISERRLPQDGRIHVLMEGHPIDLRISTLPGQFGEKVVIRILDNQTINFSLQQLGFSSDIFEQFSAQLDRSNGIALVTGPTGSGKSTTLYSALNTINSIEANVCTVEDPIEFQLAGINQFQTNEKIGLTFAAVLRSLLRQDPDVILVGEIRDAETARVAIQAALTGHLVFSTLHTNDACGTVTRLIDMGIEGYLLAASLNMVLAQRLCRRLCPKCRKPYDPPKDVRQVMERYGIECDTFYRPVGCKKCRNTGFSGRIAIHELLIIDDHMREIIATNPTLGVLREAARQAGMITLRYDGLRKVKEGITTVEEVLQSSNESWAPPKKTSDAESGARAMQTSMAGA
jgi:type IV pilus assembly protein PilB